MTSRNPESAILAAVQVAASRAGARLLRNHVGLGWQGRLVDRRGSTITLADARPLAAGLARGSSDLVGWYPVTIEPHHVGATLAAFASVEVKTQRGRLSVEQARWLEAVEAAGGLAGIARSDADVRRLIEAFRPGVAADLRPTI